MYKSFLRENYMGNKLLLKWIWASCGVLFIAAAFVSAPELYRSHKSTLTAPLPTSIDRSEDPKWELLRGTWEYFFSTNEKTADEVNEGSDTTEPPCTDWHTDPLPNADGGAVTDEPTTEPTVVPTDDLGDTTVPDDTDTVITMTPDDTEIIYDESKNMAVKVYIWGQGEYVELPLEEYITGVVIAEMSYLSEVEALRAQAVAARSFCLNRMNGKQKEHLQSAVCNRSSHCMGYYSKEDIIKKYGSDKGNEIWQRVSDAVNSTRGEYLTYNGSTVSAMFHDSSSGTTESAENIYGSKKDYLVCVRTPEEAEEHRVSFTAAKVIKSLFDSTQELEDIGVPVGETERFEDSGKCKAVYIYGKRFTALQVFVSLGLRSMDFDVSYNENEFVFVTRGFGHGIGMSQEGAKLYAKMGLDYKEILLHYYKGCEIEIMNEEKEENN